jgi:hypothetical protein
MLRNYEEFAKENQISELYVVIGGKMKVYKSFIIKPVENRQSEDRFR